jgi:hypothetical protein
LAIATGSFASPPGGDGVRGEGWRVVRNADEHGAAVGKRLVDAIGDTYSVGVGEEIVVVYQDRRTVPLAASILEVADHLAFLAIDTDDGYTAFLKVGPEHGDLLELLIAMRTGIGGDLFPVHPQRKVHVVEEAGDGVGGNRDTDLLKDLGDVLGRLPGPLQSADGIASGIVL